jgi:hypothetical protein
MKSTGHRIVLLLAVGLTAFSSAMKELNQVQQLSLDASHLVAQWSAKNVPAEVPPAVVEVPQTVVKVESCESKQSAPSVELPWLENAQTDVEKTDRPVIAKRAKANKLDVAKLNKARRFVVDPIQFEVRVPNVVHDTDGDEPVVTDFPAFTFKAKPRKHGAFRFSVRDREMLLKTLNRSINLRSAS